MATAPKQKQKAGDVSRSERRGPPGPSALVLIAGLPKETATIVARTIANDESLAWRAVASRFPPHDGAVYGDGDAILALGRAACGISANSGKDEQGVPTPSRIALAYVADVGAATPLWDVFGHAVWPIPLRHPDWRFPLGRHWRNDIPTAVQVIRQALRGAEQPDVDAVRLRLEAQRIDDALLLPGRNFSLGNEVTLSDRFRAFMNDEADTAAVEADIRKERLPFERLSRFYAKTGGRNKCFALDDRALIFARSNAGQHGGDHAFEAVPADAGAPTLRVALEGRYRFGTPFAQAGFQHDVQWPDGHPLDDQRFECSNKGPVAAEGTHVNVYPSDVVTGDLAGIK